MRNTFDNAALKAIRELDDSATMRACRAIEGSASIRAMRQLVDSPAARALRQLENSPAMQAIRHFEESPTVRMLRDLENSPALKAIEALEQSAAFKAIQQLQESPAFRAMRTLEASPAMAAFSRIAEQLGHSYGAQTFSAAYELIADEYAKQPDVDALDRLSSKVQQRATRAPLGTLSADFYFNLFLALLLFWLSQMSEQESEERILKTMNELEHTITSQLGCLDDNQHFLVTDRPLNLRSSPGVETTIVAVIPRNHKVMELKRDRDWVKVEYFDYIRNTNMVGWAHSRYLLTITPGNE